VITEAHETDLQTRHANHATQSCLFVPQGSSSLTRTLFLGLLNRRKFLKYSAAGVAIAGSALAGYELNRWQTALVPSSVSTVTQTLLETTTETLRLASLKGRLFFDYNGNGVQDAGEPAVQGASVQLKDSTGTIIAEAPTDSSGDYTLEGVITGSYRLHVEGDEKFHYMCRSTDEFTAVSEGYDVLLDRNQTADIGLVEGFLTSPFHRGKVLRIDGYVDLDPRPNQIRDWKGGDLTYDGHRGTDFIADKGTEILAAAPGRIVYAWNGWPNKPVWGEQDDTWKNGNSVQIDHGNNLWSVYNHLDSIAVSQTYWRTSGGQHVRRGQVIGYCGYTGFRPDLVTIMTPNQVHLHFEIDIPGPNFYENGDRRGGQVIDPFRDLYYGLHGDSPTSDPVSLWTKDNDPQYSVT
jgi:murein DD-endopeptidase MepM/ murein hydrolase activator NlpD